MTQPLETIDFQRSRTRLWADRRRTSLFVSLSMLIPISAICASAQNTFPASGNAGIGTAAPTAPLQLAPGAALRIEGGTGASDNANYFSFGGNGAFGIDAPGVANGRFVVLGNGNVGIGAAAPNAAFQVGTPSPAGTVGAFSPVLQTFSASPLNSTAGTDLPLASIGFKTDLNTGGNNVALGVHAYRTAAGSDWTTSSIGLGMDVDNTTRAGGNLWLNANGNVGVGTSMPGARLEVNGNLMLTSGSGASITFPDATIQATAWNGVLTGGDYAESVDVSGDREAYEPGDVLVIDPDVEGRFLKSSAPYSSAVTGIYSTKPGVVGRRQLSARTHMKEEVPMAMTGIVPTKVSAENGAIKPGDLLVTSSQSGYAMKGTDRSRMLGAVIGKAIGHLDSGVGVIEAVVTLQ